MTATCHYYPGWDLTYLPSVCHRKEEGQSLDVGLSALFEHTAVVGADIACGEQTPPRLPHTRFTTLPVGATLRCCWLQDACELSLRRPSGAPLQFRTRFDNACCGRGTHGTPPPLCALFICFAHAQVLLKRGRLPFLRSARMARAGHSLPAHLPPAPTLPEHLKRACHGTWTLLKEGRRRPVFSLNISHWVWQPIYRQLSTACRLPHYRCNTLREQHACTTPNFRAEQWDRASTSGHCRRAAATWATRLAGRRHILL